ncbi:ParA family protein [Azospirillaceae bacterium]
MPILAIATSKGGAGKTTLAACLADYWVRMDQKVVCIDTDPNRNLDDWIKNSQICSTSIVVEEEGLLDAVEKSVDAVDWVIIDVAGSLARGLLYAVSAADVVLMPCRCDRKDVIEACRTQEIIQSAGKMMRRTIAHAAVLTQVNRRADVTSHTIQQLKIMEIPVLSATVPIRTAYQKASYTGTPLSNTEIRKDIAAIVEEINAIIRR